MLDVADQFQRPDTPYFLSHSVGLMPLGATDGLIANVLEPWQRQGQSWDEWWQEIEAFRAAIGTLVGLPAKLICPQVNLSAGLTKILHAVPVPESRPVILMTAQDFPTIGFVARHAEDAGWQVRMLPGDADLTDMAVWADAMTTDVGAVIATHVWSNSSMRAPVGEICSFARERGILSILDVAQSAGCIPLDLASWQPDFTIGSCVKYLCGGPGAGWLAMHPDMVGHSHPVDVGWFSHDNPFEFNIDHFAYAPDARRFLGGTPSVLPFALARQSVARITAIGIDAIHAHNQAMIDRLLAGLDPAHVRSESRAGKRGSGLLFAPAETARIAGQLGEAGIYHDQRNGAFRLSVHLYTQPDDIDAALAALAA